MGKWKNDILTYGIEIEWIWWNCLYFSIQKLPFLTKNFQFSPKICNFGWKIFGFEPFVEHLVERRTVSNMFA